MYSLHVPLQVADSGHDFSTHGAGCDACVGLHVVGQAGGDLKGFATLRTHILASSTTCATIAPPRVVVFACSSSC